MTSIPREPMKDGDIQAAVAAMPGWAYAQNQITRNYQFKNFREALAFLVRVGFEAEGLDHHPEIKNVYNKVNLALNTHDAGGRVTAMDLELARRIEKFAPKN